MQPTTLVLYNPLAELKVSAVHRSMSETERWYAQIEKEALAVTWACEKFTDYGMATPPQVWDKCHLHAWKSKSRRTKWLLSN